MFVVSIWGKLFNLLFPDPPHIARYAHLRSTTLMQTADRVQVHRSTQCLAPLPYDQPPVRATIHAAKYHNSKRAAILLGESLAPFLAEELGDRRIMGQYLHPLLVPMPLHTKRTRERGFNQCDRIAYALAAALDDDAVDIDTYALVRTKNTHHQTRQHHRTERMQNVHKAFSVPTPAKVTGRDILLLDDVITTGATLSEAKKALKSAGARTVLCVATAH